MLRKLALAITATSATLLNTSYALGLGDIQMNSALNQPLNARIELLDAEGLRFEDIRPRLASQEAFSRAGIARDAFYSNIRFEVVQGASGDLQVLLITTQPVVEPFLNFLVEVITPSRTSTGIVREYTVLVDPVSVAGRVAPVASTAAPVRQAQPEVRQSAAVSPVQPVPRARTESLPSGQVRVQPNDTLGSIARRQLPAGVSVDQMMLAIQDLNADAFLRNNINLIKAGSLLIMPTAEQARVRSTAQATAAVQSQHDAFRTRNFASSTRAAAPQVVSAASATAPTVRASGELSIVAETGEGTATGTNADLASMQNQLALNNEENDRLQRENELLSSRLEELDSQLQMMQRIIDLRSDTGAALVEQIRQAEAVEAVEAETDVLQSGAELTDDAAAVARLAAEMMGSQEEQAADGSQAEPTAVVTTVATPVVTAPVVVPPDSWFTKVFGPLQSWVTGSVTNVVIAIAGIALLLLALLALLSRRRDTSDELTDLDEMDEMDEMESMDDFAEPMALSTVAGDDASADDLYHEEPADYQSPASDGHNPLSDAEMYLAYGHFDQALAELQGAEDRGVDIASVAEKRLEVFAEAGRRDDFESYVKSVVAIVSAASLSALRERLSLNAGPAGADVGADDIDLSHTFTVDAAADADSRVDELPVPSDDANGFDLDDLELSDTFSEQPEEAKPFDMSSFAATEAPTEPDAGNNDIHFDLDFSLDEEPVASAAAAAESLVEDDDGNGLDFDMSAFDVPEAEASAPPLVTVDDEHDLDFDLTDLPVATDSLVNSDAAASDDDSSPEELMMAMDLSTEVNDADDDSAPVALDFDLPELDEPLAVPSAEAAMAELDHLDFAMDSLPEPASADDEEAAPQPTATEMELEDDDFGILSTTDEVATKLDLAQAYIDMEDQEAAKDLLQEVMQEGDAEQQNKAKALLDTF